MVFGKNNTNLPSDPKVNFQYSLKKNALMFMKQPKRLFQTIKYKSVESGDRIHKKKNSTHKKRTHHTTNFIFKFLKIP